MAGVLFAPGLALARLFGLAGSWSERGAVALGLSIAAWPLAFLWTSPLGPVWGRVVVVALLAVCVAVALLPADLGRARRRGAGWIRAPEGGWPLAVALGLIVAIALGLRVVQARDVVLPLWVDGYHHSVVTELFLDSGGLPRTLRPYMPVDRFFYHFGFHALASAVAWTAGVAAPDAVLWTGQVLSGLAPLTMFALAAALVRRPGALAAAAVPASLYWFPMYFLTWSRYTQLAGLVLLPVAWLLVARAARRPRFVTVFAAAFAAAGLSLVHYRVMAFYVLGVTVMVSWLALERRGWRPVAAVGAVAVVSLVLAGPWLAGSFAGGVADLRAAGAQLPAAEESTLTWYDAQSGATAVPQWLFTQRMNPWLLALGAMGLAVGLLRRRAAAGAVVAVTALAFAVADPVALGLPATWLLPPFAVAISLFVPVGLGVAYLVDAGADLAAADGLHRRRVDGAVAVAVVVAVLAGALDWGGVGRGRAAPAPVDVINPVTRIAGAADVAAAEWIRGHTPPDARFLVTVGHWHLGTYRGLDGGYWLPLLADRLTTMPGALYSFGPPAEVRRITAFAVEAAKGDSLTPEELSALMDRGHADYVYLGPLGQGLGGGLTLDRLRRQPDLVEVHAAGGAHVFKRRAPGP